MASSEKCLPFITTGGLLTTVAQLPPKYKIRYLAQSIEIPLDLSVKPTLPTTNVSVPITPPPSPAKKRFRDDDYSDDTSEIPSKCTKTESPITKTEFEIIHQKELTPVKPITKLATAPKVSKSSPSVVKEKRIKAVRKLKFDEDTSSPVSGTIIRPLEEITENSSDHLSGDIDPQYNIVEVTEEAKSELASIKNVIGAYVCRLCRIEFDDAFGLARHRCSCIVLLEYRCPECGKRFNCPANLASHRRWHKPKEEVIKKQNENSKSEQQYPCTECGRSFKRQAYLRKHMSTHKNQSSKLKYSSSKGSSTCGAEDSNSMESYSSQQDIYNKNIVKRPRYDSDFESSSDCSSPGRLKIVENLTEEENIAAAALAHLRHGPSVIQHTTAALAF